MAALFLRGVKALNLPWSMPGGAGTLVYFDFPFFDDGLPVRL